MHLLVASVLLCAALESDAQFKQAQKHMDAFELEKAAALLDDISKRPALPPQDQALALVWLGIAYAELRDEARASIAFEDAITADPLIVLPKDSSPKIKALLEDARARVRLRTRNPEPAPAPLPTPIAAPLAPEQPAPAAASGSVLFPVGLATAIVGGAVAIGGGATWGVGLMLRQQAIDAEFQDDAATLNEQSGTAQLIGQVALGVGAVVAIVGGVLIGLSFTE
jgi:hypothetical protein